MCMDWSLTTYETYECVFQLHNTCQACRLRALNEDLFGIFIFLPKSFLFSFLLNASAFLDSYYFFAIQALELHALVCFSSSLSLRYGCCILSWASNRYIYFSCY
ncbi:hypothetical protein CDL12_23411 [Handroanthus impetiginosus]|uniref:Uncharacterized protein n=1 Tax=Handroanthus impetiginosus TaxID=429701 RepID=A0A2G9GFJ5_9LAMI|nr:hypothetical protein CDL12_23411 [Handroanthus impetiginosus]